MSRKNKVIIPIAPGDYLTDVKYNVHLPAKERRKKLITAVNRYTYKAIVLRLNAISIRLRIIAPTTYAKLRADMKFLKAKFRPSLD